MLRLCTVINIRRLCWASQLHARTHKQRQALKSIRPCCAADGLPATFRSEHAAGDSPVEQRGNAPAFRITRTAVLKDLDLDLCGAHGGSRHTVACPTPRRRAAPGDGAPLIPTPER